MQHLRDRNAIWAKFSHPDGEDAQPMETGGGGEEGSKARQLERLKDGQPK